MQFISLCKRGLTNVFKLDSFLNQGKKKKPRKQMGAISCLKQQEQIVSVLQMCLLHKVSASPEVPLSQVFCPK